MIQCPESGITPPRTSVATTRMIVAIPAGQTRRHILKRASGKDRDAIVGLLSVYGAIVAEIFKGLAREGVIDAFDFLQHDNIGIGRLQPRECGLGPRLDRIDVPGGDFHVGNCLRYGAVLFSDFIAEK